MSATFTKWFPYGGRGLVNFATLNQLFNNPQTSVEDKITATAGGTQAAAYKLSAAISRITTCVTNGDSVALPPSTNLAGATFAIINDGAANLDVYPGNATDNIDAVGVNTAVVITAGKRALFFYSSTGIISSLEGSKTT